MYMKGMDPYFTFFLLISILDISIIDLFVRPNYDETQFSTFFIHFSWKIEKSQKLSIWPDEYLLTEMSKNGLGHIRTSGNIHSSHPETYLNIQTCLYHRTKYFPNIFFEKYWFSRYSFTKGFLW